MEKIKNAKQISKWILIGYIINFLLMFLYSAILAYTEVSEATIPTCMLIIGIISVFVSSSLGVMKIKKNGMKNGGLIGLFYILILYLLSSINQTSFSFTKYSILTIILFIIFGMIGGIVGVNFARNK